MKKNYLILMGILVGLVLVVLIVKNSSPIFWQQSPPPNLPTTMALPQPSATPQILDLRLFFIALNDNGKNGQKIGCGDSVAPVNIELPNTPTPLQAVMQQILSLKQQTVGPSKLYNSLSQSDLQLKDASIKNGIAIIHLIGTVSLGGVCDNPRFQNQLEKTALQFSDVNSVQIFINDKPLSQVISLK